MSKILHNVSYFFQRLKKRAPSVLRRFTGTMLWHVT